MRKLKQNMTPGPVRLPIQFGHSIVNAQMKCIGIINKGNWIILFCLELKSKSILPCIFLSTLHCSQKKVLHCSLMNIKCREIKELVLDKIFRSHSAYVSFVNRIAPFSDMETTPCPYAGTLIQHPHHHHSHFLKCQKRMTKVNCNAIIELSFVNEAIFNNTTRCESKYAQPNGTHTHTHTYTRAYGWAPSGSSQV